MFDRLGLSPAICCAHSHTYAETQITYQPKPAPRALPLADLGIHDLVSHLVTGMGRSQQADEVGIVLVQVALPGPPTLSVVLTGGSIVALGGSSVPGVQSPPSLAICCARSPAAT